MTVCSGIPVVRPEVQLLYMSKSDDPKNEHDFTVAIPMLDRDSAKWLRDALAVVEPRHRWLDALT